LTVTSAPRLLSCPAVDRPHAPRRAGLGPGITSVAAAAWTAWGCGVPAASPAPDEMLRVVDSYPAPGGTLEAGRTVDLCFDGLLDPRTVDRADFVLASGRVVFDAAVVVELRPWYGPGGGPPAQAPWCPGTVVSVRPTNGVGAGVRARLRMRPDAVGWNGEPIDPMGPGFFETDEGAHLFTLEFETAPADGGTLEPWAPPEAPPNLADLFEAGRVFEPNGVCSCHTRQAPDTDPTAVARLDLSAPQAAFDDLLSPPGALSEAFPLVAPGDPSGSFLLHKVLRTEGGLPLRGVRGVPMPPAAPLPYRHFVDLARWIEGGARP